MEEVGTVTRIEGPMAIVSVARKGVCEQCSAGTCHLSEAGAEMEALNEAGAAVGQRVRVEIMSYSYLKGSAMIYGVPAVALIAGAVLGKEVGPRFFGLDSDLVSAIFAFGALGLSLAFVKLWSMKAEKKAAYRPVVKEILD